ncbi:MAG: hypothetical protein NVS4B12_14010 [Ktedonobacteraceae bacterium]
MNEQQVQAPTRTRQRYIDDFIEGTERLWAWHYFVSQAMQVSLALIRETFPGSEIGLILPLRRKKSFPSLQLPEDVSKVGRALVGWSKENRSLHVFLVSPPEFTFADDYHIEWLSKEHEPLSKDDPLLVTPRQTGSLALTHDVLETVRFLLNFVYVHQRDWLPSFQQSVSDLFAPMNRFHNGAVSPDTFLNDLADIIVQLGGSTTNGRLHWRFCCMLLPREPRFPLQQQNLFVYAQSKDAPHRIGSTVVSIDNESLCLSLRAYLSAHVHYIDDVAPKDTTIDFQALEEPIHSAIAIPIGGELGVASGVLYIASGETKAFSPANRRMLRIMSKMVENVLISYHTQHILTEYLIDVVRHPDVVDLLFEHFHSENDLRHSMRSLLENILEAEQQGLEEVSFIAIGMDNLNHLALMYGNHAMRNLHREMGQRVHSSARAWFTQYELYHIYADKFYLLLKGLPFDRAHEHARHLQKTLGGSYRIDAQHISPSQSVLPGQKVPLENLTVRLTVTSYSTEKLLEILQQHEKDTNTVSLKMRSTLEAGLKMGEEAGGNIVYVWSREQGMLVPSPSQE